MNLQILLEKSMSSHSRLCPRQILGVRLGLCGLKALNLEANQSEKRLLVITETDGCFVDGVSAATNCYVGHRTLRVEDYGKAAATFIDTQTGQAVRVAPLSTIRENASDHAPDEPHRYAAQLSAYQTMPDDEMFTVTVVELTRSLDEILSRPGLRVICDICGEEVMNEREIRLEGRILCRPCAGDSYYHKDIVINHENDTYTRK
jgi:formylmethanofuran dehydrogenase subunit E